jgi:hypothetical protein
MRPTIARYLTIVSIAVALFGLYVFLEFPDNTVMKMLSIFILVGAVAIRTRVTEANRKK